MVTRKLFQLDLLQEKNLMSYLYNDSEVKCLLYLIIKRDGPSGATELTQFAVQLHFCVPMTQRKRRKASHLFMSLPNSINLVPTRAVQDLQAWISHLSHEQVHDSASVSVDFSQAQVEKEKKIASCIPRRRLEAIHFPHTARGKKEETFLRLRSFLGQCSHTVFILTRKSCLKL